MIGANHQLASMDNVCGLAEIETGAYYLPGERKLLFILVFGMIGALVGVHRGGLRWFIPGFFLGWLGLFGWIIVYFLAYRRKPL